MAAGAVSATASAIAVGELTARFGRPVGFDRLDLDVPRGCAFGLLVDLDALGIPLVLAPPMVGGWILLLLAAAAWRESVREL